MKKHIPKQYTIKEALKLIMLKYRVAKETKNPALCAVCREFISIYYPQRHSGIILLL